MKEICESYLLFNLFQNNLVKHSNDLNEYLPAIGNKKTSTYFCADDKDFSLDSSNCLNKLVSLLAKHCQFNISCTKAKIVLDRYSSMQIENTQKPSNKSINLGIWTCWRVVYL